MLGIEYFFQKSLSLCDIFLTSVFDNSISISFKRDSVSPIITLHPNSLKNSISLLSGIN